MLFGTFDWDQNVKNEIFVTFYFWYKTLTMYIYSKRIEFKKLSERQMRNSVLNICTSFYLPESDVDKLREVAKVLLVQSKEYHKAVKALQ